jgi:hypothetical protein
MQNAIEIRHYLNRAGKDVFDDWLARPSRHARKVCVLLLCGGDKRMQSLDIDRALKYIEDYKD